MFRIRLDLKKTLHAFLAINRLEILAYEDINVAHIE